MPILSDAELARQALRDICSDPAAPAAARASAARTLAEMAGALRPERDPSAGLPNPFGMSRAEIDQELSEMEGRKP